MKRADKIGWFWGWWDTMVGTFSVCARRLHVCLFCLAFAIFRLLVFMIRFLIFFFKFRFAFTRVCLLIFSLHITLPRLLVCFYVCFFYCRLFIYFITRFYNVLHEACFSHLLFLLVTVFTCLISLCFTGLVDVWFFALVSFLHSRAFVSFICLFVCLFTTFLFECLFVCFFAFPSVFCFTLFPY